MKSLVKSNRSSPPEKTVDGVYFLVVRWVYGEHRQESGRRPDLAEWTFIRFELCAKTAGCGKFTSGLEAAVLLLELKTGSKRRNMNVSHSDGPTPSGREDKLLRSLRLCFGRGVLLRNDKK